MKKRNVKSLIWGVILIAVLLFASHLEYKLVQEEIAAKELLKEAEIERVFNEYHDNNN